ncbi:ATP-binding protein [Streptomyces sp. NPDC016309]|uniref:ATP-binding protein n=1 Tax=Streptomyces sp. NPDC016309 TaxID=3364965 RepID=UPI0036FF0E04
MGTTQQHPPSDLGPQPDGSALGVGASVPASPTAPASPEMRSDMSGAVSGPGPGATPAGRRTRRLSLGSASGIVPLARDFTRQALYDWGWLPAATADRRAAAEDVLLVVSELVTNACLHADGPEELRVSLDSKVLRLEVEDRSEGRPAPRTPHQAGRPGGHGMFIVQRLCLDWGVVRSEDLPGKTVWAELAAPA